MHRVGDMEFVIDCRKCVRSHTASCEECVVTFITTREPDEAVVIDAAEFAALRRLEAAGLIPALCQTHDRWAEELRQAG